MIVKNNNTKSDNFKSQGKMIFIGIFICIIIIIAVVFFINKNTKKSGNGNDNGNGNNNDKTASCIATSNRPYCDSTFSSNGIGQPCVGGKNTQSQCSSSSYGCCEWKVN